MEQTWVTASTGRGVGVGLDGEVADTGDRPGPRKCVVCRHVSAKWRHFGNVTPLRRARRPKKWTNLQSPNCKSVHFHPQEHGPRPFPGPQGTFRVFCGPLRTHYETETAQWGNYAERNGTFRHIPKGACGGGILGVSNVNEASYVWKPAPGGIGPIRGGGTKRHIPGNLDQDCAGMSYFVTAWTNRRPRAS